MAITMTKCKVPLTIRGKGMPIFRNNCTGGGATINAKQTLYINKLIIIGAPGGYSVNYHPTLFQKIKAAMGFYPTKTQIEDAVRRDMLGENTEPSPQKPSE
jgi:hypothetical protein